MRQEGYSIFVVKPLDDSIPNQSLPAPVFSVSRDSPNCWHTVTAIQARGTNSTNSSNQARKDAATKAKEYAENDPEYRYALEASLTEAGLSPPTFNNNNNKRNAQYMMDEDEQLRLALEASLNEADNNHHTRAVKPMNNNTNQNSTTSTSTSSSNRANTNTHQGGIRTLGSLSNNDDSDNNNKTSGTLKAGNTNGHSWGQGNTIGTPTSSVPSNNISLSPLSEEDRELQEALRLSMMEQNHIVLPSESPLEAIARLQSLLPPEPPTNDSQTSTNKGTICRIQIRLPTSQPPNDDILKVQKTIQGSTSRQRKFYSTDSLLSVFYFAELCWLEAWLETTTTTTNTTTTSSLASNTQITTNNTSISSDTVPNNNTPSSSSSSLSSVSSISNKSPYSIRNYGLSLSLPSKLFIRNDYNSLNNNNHNPIEIPTLEGAGLVPSAALNLRPL